jgi:hypothetical protein
VLNKAAETDKPNYARWLLSNFGRTAAVLEVESIEGKHFFFAGFIRVKGSITLSGFLQAGSGIKAGSGMGIFAGLKIKLTDWKTNAQVKAKVKPQNLVSGFWIEK